MRGLTGPDTGAATRLPASLTSLTLTTQSTISENKLLPTAMTAVSRDSRFDKGVSWLTLALIAVISYLSIPQIVFLDSAFTQAMHSDRPLRFADTDYAQRSPRGRIVTDDRHLLASVAIAAPLCAVGAMFLNGWLRHTILAACLFLAFAVYYYVGGRTRLRHIDALWPPFTPPSDKPTARDTVC
jgi:hypothetical protein